MMVRELDSYRLPENITKRLQKVRHAAHIPILHVPGYFPDMYIQIERAGHIVCKY